jgi:putative phage-type endonuclease
MTDIDLVQGSDAWKLARVGSLGASRIADAVARTKTGYGASRANLMAELIAERLTGIPADTYQNAAMLRGTEKEPEARAAYCFYKDCNVIQVGLIRHPTIEGTHASPDGLVGDDGMLEIKAPNTSTHIDTLLGDPISDRYIKQMQWQMACADRQYCDFVSYDDRMPEHMRLFVKRVPRDDKMIAALQMEVITFLSEVETRLLGLEKLYGKREAA